jgi:hypothetical protein
MCWSDLSLHRRGGAISGVPPGSLARGDHHPGGTDTRGDGPADAKADEHGGNRYLGFCNRPTPDGHRLLLSGPDSSRKGDPAVRTLYLRPGLASISPDFKKDRPAPSWFDDVAMGQDISPRIFEQDRVVHAGGVFGSGVVRGP